MDSPACMSCATRPGRPRSSRTPSSVRFESGSSCEPGGVGRPAHPCVNRGAMRRRSSPPRSVGHPVQGIVMIITGLILPLVVALVSWLGTLLLRPVLQDRAAVTLQGNVTFWRTEEAAGETAADREFARRQRMQSLAVLRSRQRVSAGAYPLLAIFAATSVFYAWWLGAALLDGKGLTGTAGIVLFVVVTVLGAAHALVATITTVRQRGKIIGGEADDILGEQIRPLNDLGPWRRRHIAGALVLMTTLPALGFGARIVTGHLRGVDPEGWESAGYIMLLAGVLGLMALASVLIWEVLVSNAPGRRLGHPTLGSGSSVSSQTDSVGPRRSFAGGRGGVDRPAA